MAYCYAALGDHDKAIEFYRKTLEREEEFPNVVTSTFVDYPVFVISHERFDLFPEIEDILTKNKSPLDFPIRLYKYNMCLAIIADFKGENKMAAMYARNALSAAKQEHSGFRYHPKLGLVKELDKKIKKKLIRLVAAK